MRVRSGVGEAARLDAYEGVDGFVGGVNGAGAHASGGARDAIGAAHAHGRRRQAHRAAHHLHPSAASGDLPAQRMHWTSGSFHGAEGQRLNPKDSQRGMRRLRRACAQCSPPAGLAGPTASPAGAPRRSPAPARPRLSHSSSCPPGSAGKHQSHSQEPVPHHHLHCRMR